MMCHRIGRPPISTIGLGLTPVSSAKRVPAPPARITTFMQYPETLLRPSNLFCKRLATLWRAAARFAIGAKSCNEGPGSSQPLFVDECAIDENNQCCNTLLQRGSRHPRMHRDGRRDLRQGSPRIPARAHHLRQLLDRL